MDLLGRNHPSAEAIDVVHRRDRQLLLVHRGQHLGIDRAPAAAEACRAVHHADGLRAAERLGDLPGRERTEAPDLEQADLLPPLTPLLDDVLHRARRGPEGHDDKLGVVEVVRLQQAVVATEPLAEGLPDLDDRLLGRPVGLPLVPLVLVVVVPEVQRPDADRVVDVQQWPDLRVGADEFLNRLVLFDVQQLVAVADQEAVVVVHDRQPHIGALGDGDGLDQVIV